MSKLQEIQRLYRGQTARGFLSTNPNLEIYPVMNPSASNGFTDVQIGEYLAGNTKEYSEKAPHGSWLASQGDFQNEYVTGGFFADCGLEASLVNLSLQPIFSLWNLLPIRGTIKDTLKYGFVSGIGDPTGEYPTTKCEPGQIVGDMTFCSAEYGFGRQIYSSHTLEMDELVRQAKSSMYENFYLLGSVRGVSAVPSQLQLADRDFIGRAHVRKEIALIARAHQRTLLQKLWTGDPDAVTNTPAFYDFWGLDELIDTGYGAKRFVSGDNCDALDSDVKDFESNCIGGEASFYNVLRELEDTVYQRAMLMGLLPANWAIVMHPVHWSELVRYLACEYISDSCNSAAATNVTVTVNDMSAAQMRQQMMSTMRIDLNGRSYPVVLDHGITLTNTGVPGTPVYEGTVYFVPLRAAGENVLEIWHRDYSQLAPQFVGIPAQHVTDAVYSDGGRFLWGWDLSQVSYCFGLTAKTELGLVLRAPQIAGKIINVAACPTQDKPVPFEVAVPLG